MLSHTSVHHPLSDVLFLVAPPSPSFPDTVPVNHLAHLSLPPGGFPDPGSPQIDAPLGRDLLNKPPSVSKFPFLRIPLNSVNVKGRLGGSSE